MTEAGTQQRYRLVWKRSIAFLFRAYLLSELSRRHVGICLPPDIQRQVRKLWKHRVWDTLTIDKGQWPAIMDERYQAGTQPSSTSWLDLSTREAAYASEEGFDECSDESDESNSASDADDHEPYGLDSDEEAYAEENATSFQHSARIELLFKLSITLCKQEYTDGDAGSTLLVYFSGIFGFTSDYQRFMPARLYCPSLSGLIYVQRLFFLEYALPLFRYSVLRRPARPRIGQLEHFKAVCHPYITAGSPSALAELFSLRSFGYKIGKTEVPTCLLQWSDDDQTVRCGLDLILSMDTFRRLPTYFISRAEVLCADLMYDLKTNLTLSAFKDEMTNAASGYSFVSHSSNSIADGYRQLLLSAYFINGTNPTLRIRTSTRGLVEYKRI